MTPDERIDREERAAVFEYEAGFTREVAEMLAGLRDNPTGITPEIADEAARQQRENDGRRTTRATKGWRQR